MVNLAFYLDTRYERKNNDYSLKLRITSKGKRVYLPLGEEFVFVKEAWSQETQRLLKPAKNFKQLNTRLDMMMTAWRAKVDEEFGFTNADADEVLAFLTERKEKPKKKGEVENVFAEYIDLKKDKPKSQESYIETDKKMRDYCKEYSNLCFDDIDKNWLMKFRNWLLLKGGKKGQSLSINTVAIHLENLRAVFNYAKDDMELTDKYPFKRFKIERETVIKYTFGYEDMRKMWTLEGSYDEEQYHIDMFRLIFSLCGINISDLYEARDKDVVGGRLEFNRNKTGVHGSIRIEPEAWEIINKYKGHDGMLIDASERYSDVKTWTSKLNKRLKLLGEFHWEGHNKVYDKIYWPSISTYTARYSWATFAGMEDVSYDTIDMGLTHKNNTMTAVYVRSYLRKLDVANRLILDIVTGKREPTYQDI